MSDPDETTRAPLPSNNLVRDIHDVVASRKDPAEASVRPTGTTRRELRAMERDVLRKLRIERDTSVAEIGCGIGLLGLPIAERAARYVGLDFAPQAVRVANERLGAAGLGDRASVLCVDVLGIAEEELDRLGRFDRVLMYAVLHYARNEQEAMRFLRCATDLLAPGGTALVGNIPLEDLSIGWTAGEHPPRGLFARLLAAGGWTVTPGSAVPLTVGWKARRTVEVFIKTGSSRLVKAGGSRQVEAPPGPRLPASYTLTLTTTAVEQWLTTLDRGLTHRWELPAAGVPLAPGRADLLIVCDR